MREYLIEPQVYENVACVAIIDWTEREDGDREVAGRTSEGWPFPSEGEELGQAFAPIADMSSSEVRSRLVTVLSLDLTEVKAP